MRSEQTHIILLCSRLDLPGGIERAIVNTAGLLAEKGSRVTLLVLEASGESFYPLHPEVRVLVEPMHFGITPSGNSLSRKLALWKHLQKLGRLLKKLQPQVVIGTEYPYSIAARLCSRNRSFRLYAWEHHHFHFMERNRFWRLLLRKVYPLLDGVITLNQAEASLFGSIGCTTVVIPNFISGPVNQVDERKAKELLTIGWLIPRKGTDLIPAIAEKVFEKHPDWYWRIIGKGTLLEPLKKELAQTGLDKRVRIDPPVSSDMEAVYAGAALFVLPSRFECFPMVLLEALASGLPAIAFDCPTGPRDIITEGADGLLVPKEDVSKMAGAIHALIEDEEGRKKMGEKARQNIRRFSPEQVYQLWEQLLLKK